MDNEENFWRILMNQCLQEQMQAASPQENSKHAAIVRLVDFLLQEAASRRASDLHIEPWSGEVRFRLRVDGLLVVIPYRLPAKLASPLISRVKVLANMDIAKHQQPQDGAFVFKSEARNIDVRVASMPVYGGEMMVLRFMNLQDVSLKLNELGFTTVNEKIFRQLIKSPAGLIILVGPMGSGKSTTLYSALREINTAEKKILTIEDPVEVEIAGVNQTQVNSRGLDYASALRAALRMDAEIVMLGEIRDSQTASLAVRMALTGHLILTTLHTEDAVSAIFRLLDMGIKPYLLAATLAGVLAQRLVRRCVDREKGLYQGRLAIHELLTVDQSIREAILTGQSREKMEELAKAAGMKTLWEDGMAKATAGLTSEEEVRRVLYGG